MAWWEPDSFTINTGSVTSGTVADAYTINGTDHVLDEVSGTPGFDYEYWFENIPAAVTFFRMVGYGHYDGSPSHFPRAEAWNYTLSAWVLLATFPSASVDGYYTFPIIPTSDYVSGGQCKIRLNHNQAGNPTHKLYVDMINLENMGADATTAVPTTNVPTTTPPTTVAPTTLAPTTVVPTTMLTTSAPTTPPPLVHDNNLIFFCSGNNYQGTLFMPVTISGLNFNPTFVMADDELTIPMTISGGVPIAQVFDADGELEIEISIEGSGTVNSDKTNWVGWSKIGNASFVLDMTNDSGFRPMSWKGYVYQVIQIDKNVVIYGSGGVTLAYPATSPMPTFGFKEIYNVGVKNKTAVAGDKFVHYFIDVLGALYKFSEKGLEKLGYEEFLVDLTNPVLTYDPAEKRLYISSVEDSYIFNDGALTGGYDNLNGLYRVGNSIQALSDSDVVMKPVYIITDEIDFERRGLKSIESMQFDTISEVPLFAAIDYRFNKSEGFRTTEWSPLNKSGVVHRKCSGYDFRIRLKGLDHGSFDLSYISIQFKFIDQRFTRDPKGALNVY